jgi:hypothetical protein
MDIHAPESPENIQRAHEFANSWYAGLQAILPTFEKYQDMILGVCSFSKAPRDKALLQLWARAYSWILTLNKLNEPKDYQSVAITVRALLEISVDVALIHKGDADGFAMKMAAFLEVEKLKMCEQLVAYYIDKKLPLPRMHQMHKDFIDNNKSRIENNRSIWWPKLKANDVKRWTGNDLSRDVKEVDRLYGEELTEDLDMPLEEFYRTEYRRINWHIHSGLASTWEMPIESFAISAGFGIKWSVDLAFLIAKIILLDLKLTSHLPDIRHQWQELSNERTRLFIELCPA